MKQIIALLVSCSSFSFCFAQNEIKNRTNFTTIELDSVVVKGHTPHVRTKGSVTKIQVANTVLAKMGNATRMLYHTPGLHSVNENVEVNGMGEPIYVLDGRILSDAKVLSTLPADNIKSIEIDRAPSVKYSPNGQPVIFISTIKHINDFLFLNVGNYTKQTRMFSDAGIFNIMGQYKKFSASLSYMGGRDGNKNKETYFRNIYRDDIFSTDQKRETPIVTIGHKVNFSADYQLTKKSRLGLYYFYMFSDEDNKANGTNLTNWKTQEQLRDINRKGKNLENIHSGTLQYAYRGNHYNLDITQEIAFTNSNHHTQTLESGTDVSTLTKSRGHNRYNVYTTTIDNSFSLPWKINVLAGFVYNYVDSKAKTNSEIPYMSMQNYINNIGVKESNPQAYLSLSKTFGKWTVTPAVRYQYVHRSITNVAGTVATENQFKQHFSTFCPVITVKYQPNDDWFFQLNYRRYLTQPNFSQLNSGLVYQDSLLYSRGNTDLVNEIMDRYTLSTSWKDFTLSLRYTYRKNPLVNVLVPIDATSNILTSYPMNMKNASDFRVILDYSKTVGNLELSCEGEVVFPHGEYVFKGQEYRNDKTAFNGQVNLNYSLTPTVYLFTDYTFQGRNEYLLYNQKSVQSWNMGAAASLLKNRLNINLTVNDILGKANYNNVLYRFNQVDWGTRGKNDMRGVELTVTYTIFNKEVNVRASRKNENIIQRTM